MPPLQGRINDLAGLLDPAQRQDLERKLEAFEQETSHQVVVLTVRSLDGEDIEGFSMRVVESWKLGHRGIDNGALITVSSGDRRARIEVGYGLEGVVPDAIAARIIRDVMIPSFRDGRMGEGIVRGAEAVMAAARGEEIPVERRPRAGRRGGDRVDVLLFCGIAGGLIGAFFARRSRIGAVAVASLAAFGLAYLIVHLLFDSIFAGFIGAFFGTIWSGVSGGGGRIIHLPGGGWGRSGGYGGGFGGGGFGGGGGGFGGGGASGSW